MSGLDLFQVLRVFAVQTFEIFDVLVPPSLTEARPRAFTKTAMMNRGEKPLKALSNDVEV